MLSKLRQTLTKLVAPRKERGEAFRVRQSLERLEDRAMLSASFGPMPHGYGGPGLTSHGGGGPRFADSAAIAQPPRQSTGYEPQTVQGAREVGPAFGGFQDRPAMHDAFGPRSEMRSYDLGSSPHPTWNQFFVSPAPPTRAITSRSEPTYDSSWDSFVSSPPPERAVTSRSEPTFTEEYLIVPVTSWGSSSISYSYVFVVEPIVTYIVPSKPLTATRSPLSISLESPAGAIPSATGVLAFAATLTDLPAVPQIISRDTNSVALLSAAAHDLAFQDYAPRLLLMSASVAYDRANLGSLGKETAQSEAIDGFIQPNDESVVDDIVHSTDALTREREAVNAVLRELHDVEIPPVTTTADAASAVGESQDGQVSDVQIDLQTETTADELPTGEVDGGMVLLQSTGDANESGYDLTPVYADHFERFDVPASMETSVGLYQAVDVAIDEAPAADRAPPTGSTVEPRHDIQIDDNLPTQREQPSSHKAAALIGATTLTGALLWMGRKGSEARQSEATAQKRRVRRS